MISVITCTYNTPHDVLARTWASLKAQDHSDWEWVIMDDSPGWDTWRQLYGFCADERYKVRIYRPHTPSGGNIGKVKHDAFMLGYGDTLLELDHDDELTPDCLSTVDAAMKLGADFVYSDWCEILPNGMSGRYPEGWAFGYGSDYWSEEYQVWVMRAPIVNRTTINHIVSAPNHVRAWSKNLYQHLDGHSCDYPIADDYELMVRTALKTDMIHIQKMLYKQHIGAHTAQRQRNDLIQHLVGEIASKYANQLDDKFGSL
jgi:glycosyltransferase involved in cell wall biosynthesis